MRHDQASSAGARDPTTLSTFRDLHDYGSAIARQWPWLELYSSDGSQRPHGSH